jgi:hypothetical protein
MAAELTTLTHKMAIQLHLVAESYTISSSRCRRPVWKLLDTHSSILILSSHLRLGLKCGLPPSRFPTEVFYAFVIFPIRTTCLTHLTLLDLITLIFA